MDFVHDWHPHSFNVKRHSWWRALGIHSLNLDNAAEKLSQAGWKHPGQKRSWHLTLSNMTGEVFEEGDQTYKALTKWFHSIDWAIVLVECYRGDDGAIYF